MVYFIQAVNGGPIKIGTSIQLARRLKELANEHGQELRVLAVTDGRYHEENSLHRQFAHLRIVNEWFEPGDDLLSFIVESGREWDGVDSPHANRSGRRYAVAKIDVEVLLEAKKIAALRGITLADYFSRSMEMIVAKDMQIEIRKLTRKDKTES